MATTGKEAMSSSVFSELQAKKQFLTESKKSDFEEGGGRGKKDLSLSLFPQPLQLSFLPAVNCECK